jgi:signal transduction histidine kinase
LYRLAHPDDLPDIEQAFETALSGQGDYEIEHRIVRQDTGEVRMVHARGEVECDDEGQVVRLVGAGMDITDRKQAEADREALEAKLSQAQKMQAVGRLAGGMAHDFNNKLQTILGYANLMLNEIPANHAFREDLEMIREAACQSADLTRQLLAFARRQTIAPRVIDLNETIDGMLKMLQRLVGEGIAIEWTPGRDVPPVRMDPSQVDQILANLIVNARDAIGSVGSIRLETGGVDLDDSDCEHLLGERATSGRYVLLTVCDDGEGMDEEMLANIFEPFFTTKDRGKGTGLGLATVYGIVTQNGGCLNVDSEPGRGTTFRIYLPAAPQNVSPANVAPAVSQLTDPPGSETVLLVEDDEAIMRLCKQVLKQLGYTVLAFTQPAKALEAAGQFAGEIDLLVTDVIMPEMTGRDLLAALRKRCPALPCLFMSGYTADVLSPNGVLDEDVHFLQKPFTVSDLATRLRAILQAG